MKLLLYKHREIAAQVGTAAAALLLLAMSQTWSMRREVIEQSAPINLSIITDSVVTPQVAQLIQPQKPVEQYKEDIPESLMPAQVQEKVVEQTVAAPKVEAVPPQTYSIQAEAEAIYVAKVRGYLASVKRYPTGREASIQRPSGKSRIWFVLTREGALVDAGIEESSSSMLLDAAALSTVRRANYSAFPEESWVGQTQHRFSVELDFVAPSS